MWKMNAAFSIFIFTILWCNLCRCQTTDDYCGLTVLNYRKWLINENSTIQCFSGCGNVDSLSLNRILDTGQGATISEDVEKIEQGAPTFARIIKMRHDLGPERFGAFSCEDNNGNKVVTFQQPDKKTVLFDDERSLITTRVGKTLYLHAHKGDIAMGNDNYTDDRIRWYHQGVNVTEWDGKFNVEIGSVTQADAGIYEIFYEGERHFGLHSLIRVLVLECPPDKYGTDCSQECPPCYNGGMCNEKLGKCICPSGFSGPNCDTPCGPNKIGFDCNQTCLHSTEGNVTNNCGLGYFCVADPVGCTCGSGFYGRRCEDCEDGNYGADCAQKCHCENDSEICDPVTGHCKSGCTKGWTGNSCQILDAPQLSSSPTIDIVTSESVTILWNMWKYETDKGGWGKSIIRYLVIYKQKDSNWSISGNWTDKHEATIEYLIPNSDYEIAIKTIDISDVRSNIYLKNTIDASSTLIKTSPSIDVKTKCILKTFDYLPHNLQNAFVNETCITLKWENPPKENKQRCSIDAYHIKYWDKIGNEKEINTTLLEYTFSGLNPDTQYEFEVSAWNNKRGSGYSNQQKTVKTLKRTIVTTTNEFMVDELEIHSTNWDTGNVTWKPPKVLRKNDGTEKTLKFYTIELSFLEYINCDGPHKEENTHYNTSETHYSLNFSKPFSKYRITVFPNFSDESKSDTTPIYFTTEKTAPVIAPSHLKFDKVTSTSVAVYWDDLHCHEKGEKFTYVYTVRNTFDNIIVEDKTEEFVDMYGYASINLTPETNYEITVYGRNKYGDGPSEHVSFQTSPRENVTTGIENPIEASLYINESIKNTVMLAVNIEDDDYTKSLDEITNYFVNCTPGPVWKNIANRNSIVKMTNLKSNTNYTCKIEQHRNGLLIRQSDEKHFKTDNFGVYFDGVKYDGHLYLNKTFTEKIVFNVNITTDKESKRNVKFRVHCEPDAQYAEIPSYQSTVEVVNLTAGENYTCWIEHNTEKNYTILLTKGEFFALLENDEVVTAGETKEEVKTSLTPFIIVGLLLLLLALIIMGIFCAKRKKKGKHRVTKSEQINSTGIAIRHSDGNLRKGNRESYIAKSDSMEDIPLNNDRIIKNSAVNLPVIMVSNTNNRKSRLPDFPPPVIVDGLKVKGKYVLTRMPKENQQEQFWEDVVSNRSSVIVMLNDCEFIDDLTVPGQYWPKDTCQQFGHFTVETVDIQEKGMTTMRSLRVIDNRLPAYADPFPVSQLEYIDWTSESSAVPKSHASFLSLVQLANTNMQKRGGTITIHCADGRYRCGVFCLVNILKEQSEEGHSISTAAAVDHFSNQNISIASDEVQLQFCIEMGNHIRALRTQTYEINARRESII